MFAGVSTTGYLAVGMAYVPFAALMLAVVIGAAGIDVY